MAVGQLFDDRLFHIPKPLFPFALEVFADRAAQFLLDDVIRVDERKLQPLGQLAANGRLTAAGETDERHPGHHPSTTLKRCHAAADPEWRREEGAVFVIALNETCNVAF